MYGWVDQLTGEEMRLRETVTARATERETEREAIKVQTRLLNQVDEHRSPRTEAPVNQLLYRCLDVIDIEKTTRTGYVGKIEKHISPTSAGWRWAGSRPGPKTGVSLRDLPALIGDRLRS